MGNVFIDGPPDEWQSGGKVYTDPGMWRDVEFNIDVRGVTRSFQAPGPFNVSFQSDPRTGSSNSPYFALVSQGAVYPFSGNADTGVLKYPNGQINVPLFTSPGRIRYEILVDKPSGGYRQFLVRISNGDASKVYTARDRMQTESEVWAFKLGGTVGGGAVVQPRDVVIRTVGDGEPGLLGDVVVNRSRPSAAGPVNEWTPNTGSASNNYARVASRPPTVGYVYTNAVSQDLYTFPAQPADSRTIVGAAIKLRAQGSDVGVRPLIETTDTAAVGARTRTTAPYWTATMLDVDPATGEPWTDSTLNNAKLGFSTE